MRCRKGQESIKGISWPVFFLSFKRRTGPAGVRTRTRHPCRDLRDPRPCWRGSPRRPRCRNRDSPAICPRLQGGRHRGACQKQKQKSTGRVR